MSGAAPRASLSRAGETAATGQTGPNRRPSVSVRLLSRDIPRAAAAPAVARRMPSDGFCSHGARSERAAGVACTGRAGGGDRPRRVETVILGLHDGYSPRLARRGTCVGRDGSSARPLIRRSHAADGRGSARAGVPLTALCGGGRAISRACRPCTESGEGAHDRFGHLDHRGAAAAASAAESWGGLLERTRQAHAAGVPLTGHAGGARRQNRVRSITGDVHEVAPTRYESGSACARQGPLAPGTYRARTPRPRRGCHPHGP